LVSVSAAGHSVTAASEFSVDGNAWACAHTIDAMLMPAASNSELRPYPILEIMTQPACHIRNAPTNRHVPV
jgi:hypothetical protein